MLGAYARVTKDVTRGDALPEIYQFQVRIGQMQATTASAAVGKTEEKAIASLKEKVRFTMPIYD